MTSHDVLMSTAVIFENWINTEWSIMRSSRQDCRVFVTIYY